VRNHKERSESKLLFNYHRGKLTVSFGGTIGFMGLDSNMEKRLWNVLLVFFTRGEITGSL
jgi:hypothetical protein